jgi:hypothetical protein
MALFKFTQPHSVLFFGFFSFVCCHHFIREQTKEIDGRFSSHVEEDDEDRLAPGASRIS